MSSRYDSKTTTFSPDGRLMQVEYAIEAINKAGSAIGILTKDGIILVTERQDVGSLLEQSKTSEKIYSLDQHIYCVVSGLTADANILIDYARRIGQYYKFQYGENVPVEQLVVTICDRKQEYTQFGGLRPFGAAFLFAGYDKNFKFQLYSSDPSGNYAGWKATAIGTNNLAANSFLKQEYSESMNLEQGLDLGVKAIVKTMDTSNPSASKIEVVTITHNMLGEIQGKTLKEQEVADLLQKNGFTVEKKTE